MRFLLLLFAFLLLSTAYGQSLQSVRQTATDPTADIDHVLAPLDLSQVPSGYLRERFDPFPLLASLQGDALHNGNLMYPELYEVLHRGVGSMRLALPGVPVLPAPVAWETARQNATAQTTGAPLPLAVLAQSYHVADTTAVDDQLFSISNGQLHDVPGRSRSPYLARQVFAATPARGDVIGPDVSFVVPTDLVTGDLTTGATLQIDFDDGSGYRPVAAGQTFTVNYFGRTRHSRTGQLNNKPLASPAVQRCAKDCSASLMICN